MAKQSKAVVEQAKQDLRRFLKRGETIYCILRHVSRSGMMREIDLVVMRKGQDYHITYNASIVLGYRLGTRDGIKIGGCGMDMGFALVYELGRALYPNGIKLRKGEWHNNQAVGSKVDGGYAFKHRWL